MILLSFLRDRNPFNDDPTLRNIITGVTAENKINAENAKRIGTTIINAMVGKCVIEHSFKKKDQIITMASNNAIKVNQEIILIDPQVLFQRLITVGMTSEQLPEIFQYELSSYPPALFDRKDVMKTANKPVLADAMWELVSPNAPGPSEDDCVYVIDGGSLIHRIPWQKGSTYDTIYQNYMNYVKRRYRNPVTVFDGYNDGPSTKDSTHLKRVRKQMTEVHFIGSSVMNVKKEAFLSNKKNKQSFIIQLSNVLEQNGCQTIHARGDADVLIVQTAIQAASTSNTVVIGDDTDLLILLCYYTPIDSSHKVYFRPEAKTGTHKLPRCWNIQHTKDILGACVSENMLFGHALLGCDTTSRVFGIGKGVALKQLRSSEDFNVQAEVFNNNLATSEEIAVAGEAALVSLYSGSKKRDTLDQLRVQKFFQKVGSSSSCVQPQTLPPTSAAARYFSYRVYHQVQTMKRK